MVELRKRKEAPPAPEPAAKKERKPKVAKTTNGEATAPAPTAAAPEVSTKDEAVVPPSEAPIVAPTTKPGPAKVGDTIDLDGFGGEIETHDEKKTTLKALVDASKAGVVLFTYPKASTPGCTNQVCLFRDAYDPLTATGLSIFGLSTDSPKSNTNFKTKQRLPYALLCDKGATLIAAIGFKNGSKTQRGVFVVMKDGRVLAAEPGGPAATVDVVKDVVAKLGGVDAAGKKKLEQVEVEATAAEGLKTSTKNKAVAKTAGEVADTAATLDTGA